MDIQGDIDTELRKYFKKPAYFPSREYLLQIVIWLFDFILFFVSIYIAYRLRYHVVDIFQWFGFSTIQIPHLEFPYRTELYIRYSILFSIIMSLTFIHFKLYLPRKYTSRIDDVFNIAKSAVVGTVLTLGIVFLVKWHVLSRLVIVLSGFTTFFVLSTWRLLLKSVNAQLLKRGIGTDKIFIYGAGEAGQLLLSQYRLLTPFGSSIVGFLDDNPKKVGKMIEGLPVLATDNIEKLCKKYDVRTVILAMPSAPSKRKLEIILYLRNHNIDFRIMPDVLDIITHRVSPERVGSITLFRLIDQPLTPPWRLLKRLIDIVLSIIIFMTLLPLLILIAIIIKSTSRGPIIFKQDRIGEKGKCFTIYKFRTMYVGSEKRHEDLRPISKSDGPLLVLPDDPRLTPVGKFLRRISLDELPQLVNVIKGDMSLVGPRPLMPSEIKKYKNWHLKRLTVPQGMTGLWQVSGRAAIPFDQMVKLDIYYVENWSLLLDLKIFLLTIPSVISMRGAY